jgi:hypothetical protein
VLPSFLKIYRGLPFPVRLFLGGYRIFLKARRVRVSKIRRILIGLIEHFSAATRISAVFLDQRRD